MSSPLLKGTLTRHAAVGGMTLQLQTLISYIFGWDLTHISCFSLFFSCTYRCRSTVCLRLSNRCDQCRHLSLVSHTLFSTTASRHYEPKTQRITFLCLYLNCNCSCNMTETWDIYHNHQKYECIPHSWDKWYQYINVCTTTTYICALKQSICCLSYFRIYSKL